MKTFGYVCVLLVVSLALAGASCGVDNDVERERASQRDDMAQRASNNVDLPEINNFINLKAVAEYMERLDDPNKLFYIYITTLDGTIIGYYVTRTHPISICSLMTPPEKEYPVRGSGPNPLGPAPRYDGLYTGGGDGCDHYFAFTADSNALVEFSQDFLISDVPLTIEVDQFKPKPKNPSSSSD